MRSVITCLCALVCLAGLSPAADEGVPEPEALFKQLDANGDGQLTDSEFPADRRSQFDRHVRKADENDDGKLSLDEFIAAHKEDASPNLPLNVGGGRPGRGGGDFRQRFEMMDRNKDGKVSRDEVPEQARQFLNPIFERLGKDELTLEDLGRFAPGRENRPNADGPLRRPTLIRLLDSDSDGRISKAEWAKVGDMFSQLDENGDGELDPRELMGPPPEEMMADRGRMERRDDPNRPGDGNAGRGRRFFEQLDADKDGKISKDEAPPPMRERFDRLDENDDGYLTPEELRRAIPGGNPEGRPNRPNTEESRERRRRPPAE